MRVSSLLLSWILIATLATSPLLAENPPALKLKAEPSVRHADNSLVGTSILSALPTRAEAATMAMNQRDNRAGGKTKSAIIGILIAAGIATAIILLLSGGDDDDPLPVAAPVTPATPVGTILAAGTPRVSTPSQ